MASKKKGAPKRRPSGPSGRNTKPGVLLRATEEELAAWKLGADYENSTLTQWIRRRLNQEIIRQQRSNCWLKDLPRDWVPPPEATAGEQEPAYPERWKGRYEIGQTVYVRSAGKWLLGKVQTKTNAALEVRSGAKAYVVDKWHDIQPLYKDL